MIIVIINLLIFVMTLISLLALSKAFKAVRKVQEGKILVRVVYEMESKKVITGWVRRDAVTMFTSLQRTRNNIIKVEGKSITYVDTAMVLELKEYTLLKDYVLRG